MRNILITIAVLVFLSIPFFFFVEKDSSVKPGDIYVNKTDTLMISRNCGGFITVFGKKRGFWTSDILSQKEIKENYIKY